MSVMVTNDGLSTPWRKYIYFKNNIAKEDVEMIVGREARKIGN
jgi:hypothetical protein